MTFGKILYGDAIETLLNFNKNINIYINDSDHSITYEMREYQTIISKLNYNSFVIGDNSHVTNMLSKFSIQENRNFLFFKEEPKGHWYPGGGIGISFNKD